MIDIQRIKEERGIKLEKVGIKKLLLPIRIRVKGSSEYQTPIATIELAVEVPPSTRC